MDKVTVPFDTIDHELIKWFVSMQTCTQNNFYTYVLLGVKLIWAEITHQSDD